MFTNKDSTNDRAGSVVIVISYHAVNHDHKINRPLIRFPLASLEQPHHPLPKKATTVTIQSTRARHWAGLCMKIETRFQ